MDRLPASSHATAVAALGPGGALFQADDGDIGGGAASASLSMLPTEVWPLVLECITLQSIQSCALTSKATLSALSDGLPLVRSLYVDRPSQLRQQGRLLQLLSGVRDIYICSFESGTPGDGQLENATMAMALPFFLRNFPRLESVSFGTICSSGGFRLGIFPGLNTLPAEKSECVTRLLDAFSGAFHAGALPVSLEVRGLYCPRTYSGTPSPRGCQTCRRWCQNFPLAHVVGGCFGGFFWTCLTLDEARSIILARPGGREYLQSEAWFLQLLGGGFWGRKTQLTSTTPQLFRIAEYSDRAMSQMETLIRNNYVDATRLKPSAISRAIRRSFTGLWQKQTLRKELCYIAEASFARLKRLGLPIDEELLTPKISTPDFLHVAIKRMVGGCRMLQHVSISWINELLNDGQHFVAVAEQLLGSGALPALIGLMIGGDLPLRREAARLCAGVACQNGKCAEAVVDGGAMPHLVHLLGSADLYCYANATYAISHILGFRPEQGAAMLKAGTMEPLLMLLKRQRVFDDPWMLEGVTALTRLLSSSSDHETIQTAMELFHHLLSFQTDEKVLTLACHTVDYLWRKRFDRFTSKLICDRLVELLVRPSLSDDVRRTAVGALASILRKDQAQACCIINGLTPSSTPRLLKILTDRDTTMKRYACSFIKSMVTDGPSCIERLISANYVSALAEIGEPESEAVLALIEKLRVPDTVKPSERAKAGAEREAKRRKRMAEQGQGDSSDWQRITNQFK